MITRMSKLYIKTVAENERDVNFNAVPLDFFKTGINPYRMEKEFSSSKIK